MRTPGSKLFSLSQYATPPMALPARRTVGSMADAQAHMEVGPYMLCPAALNLRMLQQALSFHTPGSELASLSAKHPACHGDQVHIQCHG